MRISDWSSDVCSSDLLAFVRLAARFEVDVAGEAGEFLAQLVRIGREAVGDVVPERELAEADLAHVELIRIDVLGVHRNEALGGDACPGVVDAVARGDAGQRGSRPDRESTRLHSS